MHTYARYSNKRMLSLHSSLQSLAEQSTAHQQAVDAVQKDLGTQQAAAKAAQDKLQEQVAALTEQCNRYRTSTHAHALALVSGLRFTDSPAADKHKIAAVLSSALDSANAC